MATVILLNKPKIKSHKELVMCVRGNEMEIRSSSHVTGENFGVKIWISVLTLATLLFNSHWNFSSKISKQLVFT